MRCTHMTLILPMLVAVVAGAFSRAEATDAGDTTRGMTLEQAKNPEVIRAVENSLMLASGGVITAEVSETLISRATGGKFLSAVARAAEQAKLDVNSTNLTLQRTVRNMDLVFNANTDNPGAVKLPGQAVRNALAVMNGVSAAGGVAAVDNFNHAVGGSGGSIATRLAGVRGEAGAASGTAAASLNWDACSRGTANRIWTSPFYIHQDMGDRNGYQGYRYKAAGLSVGWDRNLNERITLGAAFTFAHGDYHRKGASDNNSINNYGGSAYMQYYSGRRIFANIGAGYTYGRNKWNESLGPILGTQSGRNHTDSYWAGGSLGYDFQVAGRLTLTPGVGLFWSESRGSEYRSGGVFDLTVGRMRSQSLILPVDVVLEYKREINHYASVSVKAGGGYSYNFKNDGSRGAISYDYVGGEAIAVNGMAPGRHGWNATAGVKYQYKKVAVGVDYRYDGKSKFNAHRVAASIGVSF